MPRISFDDLHGRNALTRLKSLLKDPGLSYQKIGNAFGLSRQRISYLAQEFEVDAYERIRKRRLKAPCVVLRRPYPPEIERVIRKMKQAGVSVMPYLTPEKSRRNAVRRWQRAVRANGRICLIRFRQARQTVENEPFYVRFDILQKTAAEVFLFVIRSSPVKLYVIPRSHVRNLSSIYIPADGKFRRPPRAGGRKRDWTRYENAWHLFGDRAQNQRQARRGKIAPAL